MRIDLANLFDQSPCFFVLWRFGEGRVGWVLSMPPASYEYLTYKAGNLCTCSKRVRCGMLGKGGLE